jgi:hypothetical protein
VSGDTLESVGSPDNLIGLNMLSPQDQQRVRHAFEQGQVPEHTEATGMVRSCKQLHCGTSELDGGLLSCNMPQVVLDCCKTNSCKQLLCDACGLAGGLLSCDRHIVVLAVGCVAQHQILQAAALRF